ncbi:Rapid alkalinization factor (RALF) family protein [Corchorus olitorius]|uniref:Rapid alkalinization factor (RALF) family protein n=1 Tax=Corchorus olitorius TaxID=93759 RepID=A0A1R3HGK0_9ROSI|nr:Rapid alkalinization factor (RALF) family protein [Corchorus olitorius]
MAVLRRLVACLCVIVLYLTSSAVQARGIDYSTIGRTTPPCSTNQPEKCVTHRPPANQQKRPCNPGDRCRSGKASKHE